MYYCDLKMHSTVFLAAKASPRAAIWSALKGVSSESFHSFLSTSCSGQRSSHLSWSLARQFFTSPSLPGLQVILELAFEISFLFGSADPLFSHGDESSATTNTSNDEYEPKGAVTWHQTTRRKEKNAPDLNENLFILASFLIRKNKSH